MTAATAKTTPAAVVTAEALFAVVDPRPSDPDPVDRLPRSPDFVLRDLDDPVAPHPGATDSPEAARYKAALRELYDGWGVATAVSRPILRRRLGVPDATSAVLSGLRADETVPRSLMSTVDMPGRLRPFAEEFVEAMTYPVFDLPMYRPLLDRSAEALLPNLDLLPANSITLLANNREFIEAYLVGLNHQMACELLWREYPTDQRGTPFRQFWDTRVAQSAPGESAVERRERGYDIPPLHTWPAGALLGANENPAGPPRGDDLVLAIRGELLKKYPTAAVYAHRADWARGADGHPDVTAERVLAELPSDGSLPASVVRLPRYEATVEPDVYLLGFDLSRTEALGSPPTDPGWFFVIKERPGDPRFGVDDAPAGPVEVWNDLTWDHVDPDGRGFLVLDPGTTVALAPFDGSEDDVEKQEQRGEDENLPLWFAGLSSADLAYVLFQVPVLVAVHAQEMLPR